MSPDDKNFKKTLLQTRMNVCKAGDGFLGNLFIAPFHEAFKKFSNLSLQCPIKKGFYYIQNFQLANLNLPMNSLKFKLKERVFAIVENEKKKKFLCKIDITGTYEKF